MLKKVLLFGDTHFPYQDRKAWKLLLKVGRYLKPEIIVCLGDLPDFYRLSTFSKDPAREYTLEGELAECNKALDQLDELGAKQKLFIAGNHDFRLERYLHERAPDLAHLITVPKLFRLEERDWTYVPYKQDFQLGKLFLTHDVGTSGKYAVHRALDAYQHSNATAHTHRLSYVVQGDSTGQPKVAASFGHLCDIESADYMHALKARKDWALGFGVGYLDTSKCGGGVVHLQPVPIVNYRAVVEGVLFK